MQVVVVFDYPDIDDPDSPEADAAVEELEIDLKNAFGTDDAQRTWAVEEVFGDDKPEAWAKCNECGGEVVFDSWAHLNTDIHSSFDENICLNCDGHNMKYTETTEPRG